MKHVRPFLFALTLCMAAEAVQAQPQQQRFFQLDRSKQAAPAQQPAKFFPLSQQRGRMKLTFQPTKPLPVRPKFDGEPLPLAQPDVRKPQEAPMGAEQARQLLSIYPSVD